MAFDIEQFVGRAYLSTDRVADKAQIMSRELAAGEALPSMRGWLSKCALASSPQSAPTRSLNATGLSKISREMSASSRRGCAACQSMK